jgi:hypothetical protein
MFLVFRVLATTNDLVQLTYKVLRPYHLWFTNEEPENHQLFCYILQSQTVLK